MERLAQDSKNKYHKTSTGVKLMPLRLNPLFVLSLALICITVLDSALTEFALHHTEGAELNPVITFLHKNSFLKLMIYRVSVLAGLLVLLYLSWFSKSQREALKNTGFLKLMQKSSFSEYPNPVLFYLRVMGLSAFVFLFASKLMAVINNILFIITGMSLIGRVETGLPDLPHGIIIALITLPVFFCLMRVGYHCFIFNKR